MNDIAIRVENLSKQYEIGRARQRHDTLRDAIAGAFRRDGGGATEPFWALRDVSFEVRRGEVVGIIGRNGAGKSTLLKILSQITEPTSGRAEIHGRVGSLLEVGTGFHPELTGRENIYLNGAILGMRRAEITRKFDEIVAFSEIEKFLETPVKRYSSGMYVRLAFAVAAHLEPEILLVDEVLAVGDAAFQKKALGKMGDVVHEGRTVLFVSHNMAAISRLCQRAILVDSGIIVLDGASDSVTHAYHAFGKNSLAEREWSDLNTAPGDSIARLHSVRVLNKRKEPAETISIQEPLYIEIQYWNFQSSLKPTAILHLYNDEGICLFASNDWSNVEWWETTRQPGLVKATCKIPGNFLAEGNFYVLAAIGSYNPNMIHALERDVTSFQVVDRTSGEGVRVEFAGGNWPGVVRPQLEWTIESNPGSDGTRIE